MLQLKEIKIGLIQNYIYIKHYGIGLHYIEVVKKNWINLLKNIMKNIKEKKILLQKKNLTAYL